jgi:hypothetical protein
MRHGVQVLVRSVEFRDHGIRSRTSRRQPRATAHLSRISSFGTRSPVCGGRCHVLEFVEVLLHVRKRAVITSLLTYPVVSSAVCNAFFVHLLSKAVVILAWLIGSTAETVTPPPDVYNRICLSGRVLSSGTV